MADTSWAERRRRMVKCKIHGLHYDPEMSTGCTRCLREAARAGRPRRPPQLVLILLCLLGMAGILFYVFGPGQRPATDVIDLGVVSQPPATAERLSPEPLRGQIENLETALFRTRIDEADDLLIASADIAAAAQDLGATILEVDPTGGLTAADLIARFGQSVPTDQVAQSDIERAQDQWLRIRKQQLQPADWFFSPSAGTEAGAAAAAADYSAVAADLRSSIEDGLAEVEALADAAREAVPGAPDPAERWRSFAGDWRDRLDRLHSRLPARPSADADGGLLSAVQDLEQAFSQARALARTANPPDALDDRFDDAINAALSAQQGFDDVQ